MGWAQHLEPAGVVAATHRIVTLLVIYLVMCIYMAFRLAVSHPVGRDAAETAEQSIQLVAALAFCPGLILGLFLLHDLANLAVTFPFWGAWIVLLVVAILWIVIRFFTLNQDQVGDYTIEADQRASADATLERQAAGKRTLIRALCVWMLCIVIAIIWLLILGGVTTESIF